MAARIASLGPRMSPSVTGRRLADIPFDAAAGEVLFLPPADVLRARPAHVETVRLVAVGAGGERMLGEYAFDHRPWPGW